MILYIFFIAIALILSYVAIRKRGNLIAFIIAIVAFAFSIMALPILVAQPQTQVANTIITTSSGNIIVNGYNETTGPPSQTLSYGLALAELFAFAEFGFMFYILGCMFWERKKRRYR